MNKRYAVWGIDGSFGTKAAAGIASAIKATKDKVRGAPKGNQNAAKEQPKSRQVVVRMTEAEHSELMRKRGNHSPSEYVRMAINAFRDMSRAAERDKTKAQQRGRSR